MTFKKPFNRIKDIFIVKNIKHTRHGLTRITGTDGISRTHANRISGIEWNKLMDYVETLEKRITNLEAIN